MRKFFVRLLAAVLILQFSWVAAASGCMHEADPNASHFGHHTHVHKLAKSDSTKQDGKLAADNDCGVCHLACSSAPVAEMGWSVANVHGDAPTLVPGLHPDARSDAPDRPRWSRLA